MGPRRFDSRLLGIDGERRAAAWYEANGYEVVERNWRCPDGEIDLILRRGRTVVICEVKTRSTDRFGSPFAAVGADKQRRLRRLGARWLRECAHGGSVQLRFDVAGVTGARVQVIEAAF